MKQRLYYIDALRGFAITLVVLGHVLQHFYSDDALAVRVVYSFHIPLFFFICGYVGYRLQTWEKIGQRFIQCIVPFFSAMLLSYFIHSFGHWSLSGLVSNTWSVMQNPDYGLWFLWALFFISVIFLATRKIAATLRANEMVAAISVAGILNVVELLTRIDTFGFHWIAWYYMFFAMGVYWRVLMRKERPTLDKTVLIGSAILFPIAVYFFKMHNEAPTFYQWIDLGRYFPIAYRILVGVLGIALFYELFKWWKARLNAKCKLVLIGGGTLGIYYLHFYCLTLLFMLKIEGFVPLQVVATTIIALAVSYYATLLCKKSKITRLLILGENIFKGKKN